MRIAQASALGPALWCAACLAGAGLLLLAATAGAQDASAGAAGRKELVAVMDLGFLGGSQPQAAALTNQLRSELLKTGAVTLVDRSQMEAILNEQALQQSGCTTQECAVQVGAVLGVRKIITGQLTKLSEELWQVSVQMVDVETMETIRAESFNHDGDFRSLLLQGIAKAAAYLAGVSVAEGAAASPTPAAPAPPAQPAPRTVPRVVVLPTSVSGTANLRDIKTAFRGMLAQALRLFHDTGLIQVTHSYYNLGSSLQAASLAGQTDLESKAWKGLTKVPDTDFLLQQGSQLGADLVVLFKITDMVCRGDYTLYVYEVRTKQLHEKPGKWGEACDATSPVVRDYRDLLRGVIANR